MSQNRAKTTVVPRKLIKNTLSMNDFAQMNGVLCRKCESDNDIDAWLVVREQAFAEHRGPLRNLSADRKWTRADFAREFNVGAWKSEAWVAWADQVPVGIGGWRIGSANDPGRASICWLGVIPSRRRAGVASLILSAVEHSCILAGARIFELETLPTWSAAIAFYQSQGYSFA